MNVVIDTNIILVSLSRRSKTHWVFERFLNQEFTLCLTTDILNEYVEIIGQHLGQEAVDLFLQTIEEAENIRYITRYFEWRLIIADPDDNKFVDCAVAANAQLIVTEDKHFNILHTIPFPKVNVVGVDTFKGYFDNTD